MSSKERRQKKLFVIKPENKKYVTPHICKSYDIPSLRYAMYLPLHQLWQQYMDDLMQGANAYCSLLH